jgi:poly(A) polymerase Pap1
MGKMNAQYLLEEEELYEAFIESERRSETNQAVILELKELVNKFQLRESGAKSINSLMAVAWGEAVDVVERAISLRGGYDS